MHEIWHRSLYRGQYRGKNGLLSFSAISRQIFDAFSMLRRFWDLLYIPHWLKLHGTLIWARIDLGGLQQTRNDSHIQKLNSCPCFPTILNPCKPPLSAHLPVQTVQVSYLVSQCVRWMAWTLGNSRFLALERPFFAFPTKFNFFKSSPQTPSQKITSNSTSWRLKRYNTMQLQDSRRLQRVIILI